MQEETLSLNWRNLIGEIAGPQKINETRERWLERAARKSKLSFRQIKSLYYGQTTDPRTSTTVRVLEAANKARADAARLAGQFENLAGALHAKDQDFYSADVLTLIDAARALRGLDRT